ncbi:MAG: sigma-70 family RNA polymerase sigma factor [Bacteroidales bacterium]|nr:MAG: sigma-70 family RNA polymerase sigma factor [Bacteroidales bacterium]
MTPTEISKLSDEELITLVVKNHPHAISHIVDRYKGMVFTLSFRILKNQLDAEEAAQDSFVKAFHAIKTFRFDCKFSTWLYRICYNNAISKARVYKPVQVDVDSKFDLPVNTPNALDSLSAKDRARYLNKAMETLESEESALLTLYYMDGESIGDISAITNLTESNVKVKLHRGRKKLYSQLNVLLKEEVSMLL